MEMKVRKGDRGASKGPHSDLESLEFAFDIFAGARLGASESLLGLDLDPIAVLLESALEEIDV